MAGTVVLAVLALVACAVLAWLPSPRSWITTTTAVSGSTPLAPRFYRVPTDDFGGF